MSDNSIEENFSKPVISRRHSYIELAPYKSPMAFSENGSTLITKPNLGRSISQRRSRASEHRTDPSGRTIESARFESLRKASVSSPTRKVRPKYPRSLRSLIPLISCYSMLLASGYAISVLLPESVMRFPLVISSLRVVCSIPLGLIPSAIYLVKIIRKIYDTYIEMGENHIRLIQGRCSLRMRRIEIGYDSIAFVSVGQSLTDRLLRVGTIKVGRYNDEDPEIVLDGIDKPHRLSKIIKATLENRHNYQLIAMTS